MIYRYSRVLVGRRNGGTKPPTTKLWKYVQEIESCLSVCVCVCATKTCLANF